MTCHHNTPIDYHLPLDDQQIHLNPHIGSRIELSWSGAIECIHCGNRTKKSFSQGHCYPCFKKLAQCDLCIVSPERCHYDQGTCRDANWGESFCMQPHIVYLANSSGAKVGITTESNLPTRWIDQGAVQAIPILSVQTRQQSGLVEVAFKQHISDKTHWQRMLKSSSQEMDMTALRDQLLVDVEPDLSALRGLFGAEAIQPIEADVRVFDYPVQQYPEKVKSMSFDKTSEVQGILQGIKGQYLILDGGVINLRKFTGYEITFKGATDPAADVEQLSLL